MKQWKKYIIATMAFAMLVTSVAGAPIKEASEESVKPSNLEQSEMSEIPEYEGYTLKWHDEFEAPELNRKDWNVETHDPGWVNQEWQAYVDSTENIYVKDGKLVIKPITKRRRRKCSLHFWTY